MNPENPQTEPILPDDPEPQQPVAPQATQNMDVVVPPPDTATPVDQPIQMPPYAPAQPPMAASSPEPIASSSPEMPVPNTEQATSNAHAKKDVLGILSIAFVFLGLLPVGFILGLVGASKAKKAQRSVILSRIGWILNLVVMLVAIPLLVIFIMNRMDVENAKTRDVERAQDLGAIESKLEDFFKENFGYPNSLDEIGVSDKQILIGPNGSTILVNDVAEDEAAAKATSNPTSVKEYIYTPYGKPTCIKTCDGYVLKGYVEKPELGVTNPLVKLGLENL